MVLPGQFGLICGNGNPGVKFPFSSFQFPVSNVRHLVCGLLLAKGEAHDRYLNFVGCGCYCSYLGILDHSKTQTKTSLMPHSVERLAIDPLIFSIFNFQSPVSNPKSAIPPGRRPLWAGGRSPQSEIRNPKSAIRNPKSAIQRCCPNGF